MQQRRLIQLAGTFIFILVMTLIEYFINGTTDAPFYISNWFLGLSLFFIFNPNDKLINSLLVTLLLPALFIEILLFGSGFFYDIHHLPILAVIIYILSYKRETVDFNYTVLFSFFVTVWFIMMVTLGYAYSNIYLHWVYTALIFPINTDVAFSILFPTLMFANMCLLYIILAKQQAETRIYATSALPKAGMELSPLKMGIAATFDIIRVPLQTLTLALIISIAYYIGCYWIFGTGFITLALCTWWFAGSITYLVNTKNVFLNSFLVSSFIPMLLTMAESFTYVNAYGYLDWGHMLPLTIVLSIFYFNRPIRLRLIWIFMLIEVIWFFSVYAIIYVPMNPFPFLFATILNAVVVTLFLRYRYNRALRLKVRTQKMD
jgi:hypothetical protein